MPKLDKVKEELGWLKVMFAIAVATDLSLMAYLVQHYKVQDIYFTYANIISVLFVTVTIVFINKVAYKKIDEIGEL
jgi:hypothetical protein